MSRGILAVLCLLAWRVSPAVDTEPAFDDPTLNARYYELIHEVRCAMCQNQTIADSNAFLAADLRREIHERIAQGATDDEIVAFLVGRYGDFIMYRPPVKPLTWALWGGPAALLILGGFIFLRVVRDRARQPLDDEEELA